MVVRSALPEFTGQGQPNRSGNVAASLKFPMVGVVTPAAKSTFSAAFVLPITRDDRVLLAKEKRGQITKYGMLGGAARPEENDFQCMAREAREETGGALSHITIARIAEGRGILDGGKVYYDKAGSWACKHDLVVPADLDVHTRFEPSKAAQMRTSRVTIKKKKRSKPPTEQLGIEFVEIEKVRDCQWRDKNMHHTASVLAARLMKLGVVYS